MDLRHCQKQRRELLAAGDDAEFAACLIKLMTSWPPVASPMTFAFELCACKRKDEKSGVLSGKGTRPSTLPPLAVTMSQVSFSIAWPKA